MWKENQHVNNAKKMKYQSKQARNIYVLLITTVKTGLAEKRREEKRREGKGREGKRREEKGREENRRKNKTTRRNRTRQHKKKPNKTRREENGQVNYQSLTPLRLNDSSPAHHAIPQFSAPPPPALRYSSTALL